MTEESATQEPGAGGVVLRVVKGEPSPEQVAALVVVLGALGGAAAEAPRRMPAWSQPTRRHRNPVAHGPGGWRSSALPR